MGYLVPIALHCKDVEVMSGDTLVGFMVIS